ncbi:Mitochondrial import inner membrane translocase subunit tim14 [Nucella lapillus]
MASGLVLAGLGMAVIGFAGRSGLGYARLAQNTLKKQFEAIASSGALSKYYKGGFEPKMNKREAGLILGVSSSASKTRLKEAHKRIMLLNHPDRGGSPYLAAKVNEAKDYLDHAKPGSS